MKFTTFFTLLCVTLFGLCSQLIGALPVTEESLEKRDVWAPTILYPHSGTVWYSGQQHNVTWDLSSQPVNITNPIAFILFRFGNIGSPFILADNIDLRVGRTEITVPYVLTGSDFSLVLIGDSGNWSDEFEIIGKTL